MITIKTFKTDFGTLGRNGALGFRDYAVSLDPQYQDWETLGIHGDSEIVLHCNESILLCGGLNGTSCFNDRSPRIRFYIDGIPFGESEKPWQMTERIVLAEGDHVLRTQLIDPAPNIASDFWIDHMRETLAHTVWLYKTADGRRQTAADKYNTLFVSAAAFGTETQEQTKLFRESAAEHGIAIELYDTDQEFKTFFEHKIKNFLTHLIEWKSLGIEYVFSLDSRDIVFRHPVEIMLGKFNALREEGKILIAKDLGGVVHPFFYHWLGGELQKIVGKDFEINTGVIAGHVDDLIKVYTGIIELREEFLSGIARSEILAKLFKYAETHPVPHQRFAIENDEHEERETAQKPLVVQWNNFESRVAQQKAVRDSLRHQNFCFYPWVIAEHFGIGWQDFSQGNRGSCAGCATNHAVNAMLLTHLADGYHLRYKRFNPFLTWELGKKDAGIRGEGASLSAMLACANRRGMFDVEKAGTYEQTLRTPPSYTDEVLSEAERCQIGACYLGHFRGAELARVVFDCLAAGFPITFGNSVAVSQQVRYAEKIKTAVNRGSWMHATARIAYRKEADGTEYIAHQGSWGKYWEAGKYEHEPASVIWESFNTFCEQCSGKYADAFAICMIEGDFLLPDNFDLAPVKITSSFGGVR